MSSSQPAASPAGAVLWVAVLGLAFTGLFFTEYRSPFSAVYVPYDLPGYHHPLEQYAFQRLSHGSFPAWDPTMYAGLPLAANSQAAIFYPPNWLLWAANAGKGRVTYGSLRDYVFLHVWLAFVLCYAWLAWRKLHPVAALCGAGIFAYSGYMMVQLQHAGVVAGLAWLPLALWGIDECDASGGYRPLWKTVAASSLALLAGYPPFWTVFAVCALGYAAGRRNGWRLAPATAAALAGSLAVAAVQVLPAAEAGRLMFLEYRYGRGMRDPAFFLSYVIPNFYNFGLNTPVQTNPGKDYLYLGACAMVGVPLALRRLKETLPALAMLAATLVFLTNPLDVVSSALSGAMFLSQVIRDWYFLAGVTAAAASLAAVGLDGALKARRGTSPNALFVLFAGATAAWIARLLWLWRARDGGFSFGWRAAVEPAVGVALFAAGLLLYPGAGKRKRAAIAALLVVLCAAEYKAFGTSKRFNAARGTPRDYWRDPFPGLDPALYRAMAANPGFRLLINDGGASSPELRHTPLTTPQGFDPFLPLAYRRLIEQFGTFHTDRLFDLDPFRYEALKLLGVRYYLTPEYAPEFAPLMRSPQFRLLQPATSFYKVFELVDARPAYGWEKEDPSATVSLSRWDPETRRFLVNSREGGVFRLSEQFFPGWRASVDGAPVPLGRCHMAFQCIGVPAGEHAVEFRFFSGTLMLGAIISAAAIGMAVWGFGRKWRPSPSKSLKPASAG